MRTSSGARYIRSLPFLVLALIIGCSHSLAHAAPIVSCRLVNLGSPSSRDADLGAPFRYELSVPADGLHHSDLLVLDESGEIVESLPLDDGDRIKVAIRDRIIIRERVGGARYMIHAPGVLVRAEWRDGFRVERATCSPYAVIRVDQPEDAVFATDGSEGLGHVRLQVGFGRMTPDTIRIRVDCVDVLPLVGGSIPGGPFSGSGLIAGQLVTVSQFTSDLVAGTLAFTLSGLPGGGHLVEVSGRPEYESDLPPGYLHWNRPLGVLRHVRQIDVFDVDITEPVADALLDLGPVTVRVTATHGRNIAAIRVHGVNPALAPELVTPATECRGEIHVVNFESTVPAANLLQDFEAGTDPASTVDPGVNYVSAIATDSSSHAAGDRTRFSSGPIQTQPNALNSPSSHECPPDCPLPTVPAGFVENALAVSLSEEAIDASLRARLLEDLRPQLGEYFQSIVGLRIESVINPCAEGSPAAIAIPVQWDPHSPGFQSTHGEQLPAVSPLNQPPVLDHIPTPQNVDRTKLLSIVLHAVDPDGDPITYSVSPPSDHWGIFDDDVFRYTPPCDHVGSHIVTFTASDGLLSSSQSVEIIVSNADVSVPFNPTIAGVDYDPATMSMTTELTAQEELLIKIDTGAAVIHLSIDECYVDCFFCCCCGIDIDFDISISNVHLEALITREQLVCALPVGTHLTTEATLEGFDVDWGDLHTGCLACFGFTLFVEIGNSLGLPELVMDHLLGPYVINPLIQDKLEVAIRDRFQDFGDDMAGLLNFSPSEELPPAIPLEFSACPSKSLRVTPHGSVSMGIHSRFTSTAPLDSPAPWVPTPSDFGKAEDVGADLMLAVSDDALNQMLSELTASGRLRGAFRGFTLGDVAGSIDPQVLLLLQSAGITIATPIVLTLDAAQDSEGNAIPPLLALMDDAGTAAVELRVRTQQLVRAVVERGTPLGDDRNLCSCLDFRPECAGLPCILFESLLKLNLQVECRIAGRPPNPAVISFVVTDVQELAREEGFNASESVDLAQSETTIVRTSADSPLLARLEAALNENLPPFEIPAEALTLGDFVPTQAPRLFSQRVDGAGQGEQDYMGLMADVESPGIIRPTPTRVPGRRAAATRAVPTRSRSTEDHESPRE